MASSTLEHQAPPLTLRYLLNLPLKPQIKLFKLLFHRPQKEVQKNSKFRSKLKFISPKTVSAKMIPLRRNLTRLTKILRHPLQPRFPLFPPHQHFSTTPTPRPQTPQAHLKANPRAPKPNKAKKPQKLVLKVQNYS